jgi:RNA polymerase primary sigma factor
MAAADQQSQIKNLIALGKEKGFLTFAEVSDSLPEIVDSEQIESVISMINDMGIQVYDEAPDTETLLMSENTPTTTDEDAVEEAAAALSTLDSEFGRTTDPVRMYMREMGSVELLTREGEIEIAKRIEDGLKHMIQAISACPTTIGEILELAEKVERDELRVDEVVDGLHDPNADDAVAEEAMPEEAMEEELNAEEDDDEGGAAQTASLLQLKVAAMERFEHIRGLNKKMITACSARA